MSSATAQIGGAQAEPSPSRRSGGISFSTLLFAVSAGICVQVLVLLTQSGGDPVDALCYWLTDPANPYNRTEYQFVYPPVAAQIMGPLFTLPFKVFTAILRAAEVVSLIVLAGPLAGALIFATPVASEINAANINLLIGVGMVLGFRWPALWVIPLLTKPSMGIGLVWFLVRGEWRKAAIPVAIAGVLAAVSFAYAPHLWFDWLALLAGGTAQTGEWPSPYPIWVRLPIALAIVVWGARTNRAWTVVLASALALPRLYYQSPAILVAMIPLIPSLGRLVAPWTRRLGRLDDRA
ncbi:MAG: glycosyltransferase family 87 protein [Candidatus Limnocylindrales bacterium]